MGMFDKDKEIGLILTRAFTQGEHFIVFSAEVAREDFPTRLGPSAQARLTVAKLDKPRERFEVATLASAIVAKVREAEESDFPARVFWTTAPSRQFAQDATVLQFVAPWGTQAADPAEDAISGDPGPMADPMAGRED